MITEKKYKKALKIVLAYQEQIKKESELIETTKVKYKNHFLVEEGDLVECVQVHGNSSENLTKGKKYEVVLTRLSYNEREKDFYIISDKGVKKFYSSKNTQFKIIK